jgi:hypothetical protein
MVFAKKIYGHVVQMWAFDSTMWQWGIIFYVIFM